MRRCDGRPLKSIGPFIKMMPYIMTRRSDSQIFYKQLLQTDRINAYLKEKREQGHSVNYLDFFISLYVRIIAERPQLNRFVMNNRLYARDNICISMAVKRLLYDDAEETTVKFAFTGQENIFEIARIVDQKISECTPTTAPNNVDKVASLIMLLPGKKMLVGILKFIDRHNLLPRALVDTSPFHTSLFLTYLKSIKLDYVYHHIYDFGTTSIFVALGKIKKIPVVENNDVVIRSCCEIGYTLDERICDGLYFSNSLKLVEKYVKEPYLLETGLTERVQDVK